MQFAAALSTATELDTACDDVASRLAEQLGDTPPDLLAVFASPRYGNLTRIGPELIERIGARNAFGCSGGGIIGAGEEHENQAALAVLAAHLPRADVAVRHVEDSALPGPDAPPSAWLDALELTGIDDIAGVIVLPEPFSFSTDTLLTGLDYALPHVAKIGGLASGGQEPGQHTLFAGSGGEHHTSGAVVVAFHGAIRVDPLVAQGCRPIGTPGRITRCEKNLLIEVDGGPATTFFETQIRALSAEETKLATNVPMFLGIAMDPFALESQGPGEFLVRNIMGLDRDAGVVAVGEMLAVGRQVQLHVRDAASSAADLHAILGAHAARDDVATPSGALLFSCLGRGEHLYGENAHDSRAFRDVLGPAPLGGFFCNGEIGPVHGTTYLHGYTSSFAVFSPRDGANP